MIPFRRFVLRLVFALSALVANTVRDFVPEPYRIIPLVYSGCFIGFGMLYFATFPWLAGVKGRGFVHFVKDMFQDLQVDHDELNMVITDGRDVRFCAGCRRPVRPDPSEHGWVDAEGKTTCDRVGERHRVE